MSRITDLKGRITDLGEALLADCDRRAWEAVAPADLAEALLRDILDRPDDDTPRLVLADWLTDHGEPARAEFIRVQVEKARLWGRRDSLGRRIAHTNWKKIKPLLRREGELLDAHLGRWFPDPCWGGFVFLTATPVRASPADAPWAVLRRGFVEEVALGAGDWLASEFSLRAACPLVRVVLTTDLVLDWLRQTQLRGDPASPVNTEVQFVGEARPRTTTRLALFSDGVLDADALLAALWPGIAFDLAGFTLATPPQSSGVAFELPAS